MNLNESWVLAIRSKVRRVLAKFPASDQARLVQVIHDLPKDLFVGDIEKMTDRETWRRRIGNYRIFYEIIPLQRVIYVFEIKRRTSSTY